MDWNLYLNRQRVDASSFRVTRRFERASDQAVPSCITCVILQPFRPEQQYKNTWHHVRLERVWSDGVTHTAFEHAAMPLHCFQDTAKFTFERRPAIADIEFADELCVRDLAGFGINESAETAEKPAEARKRTARVEAVLQVQTDERVHTYVCSACTVHRTREGSNVKFFLGAKLCVELEVKRKERQIIWKGGVVAAVCLAGVPLIVY